MRENPTISSSPPWKLFAFVGLTLLILVGLLYWSLGSLAGWAAARVPYDFEQRIGDAFAAAIKTKSTPESERLQELVDRLAAQAPSTPLHYRVHLIEADAVNAAALPGGHILVFRGLLREAESENELAMILGHELAHLINRDHLRVLGRRAALAAVLLTLGGDGLAQDILSGGLQTFDRKFSRDQESAADAMGLTLLHETYGHVGGATDFFERRLADPMHPTPPELFSSHPLSRQRIEALRALAQERGFAEGVLVPW